MNNCLESGFKKHEFINKIKLLREIFQKIMLNKELLDKFEEEKIMIFHERKFQEIYEIIIFQK